MQSKKSIGNASYQLPNSSCAVRRHDTQDVVVLPATFGSWLTYEGEMFHIGD
jgi:hypothetical protein